MTLYLYNICDSGFLRQNSKHAKVTLTCSLFFAEEFKSVAQINEYFQENNISSQEQLSNFVILQRVET